MQVYEIVVLGLTKMIQIGFDANRQLVDIVVIQIFLLLIGDLHVIEQREVLQEPRYLDSRFLSARGCTLLASTSSCRRLEDIWSIGLNPAASQLHRCANEAFSSSSIQERIE